MSDPVNAEPESALRSDLRARGSGRRATVLVGAANLFLIVFAVDAGASLVDDGVRALTGSAVLTGTRNAIAGLALSLALPTFLLTAVSPRLPGRLMLPLLLVLVWLALGAAPLGLVLAPAQRGFAMTLIQLLVATAALLWVRTRSGSGRWLLGARGQIDFSGRRAFAFLSMAVVLGVPAALAHLFLSLLTWLELGTQGFLQVDARGLSMAERQYVHDGRRVDLVGMMHVGNADAYASLYDSFATPSTVVLQEGVTDAEERIEGPLGYGRAAEVLGLAEQQPIERYFDEVWDDESRNAEERWPRVWRSDMDAASFSPDTLEFMRRAAAVWAAPDFASLATRLLEASRRPIDLPVVLDDLVVRRNAHLLGRLDEALLEYERVVVPWGALHLPGIEAGLLERGFRRTTESTRELVSWWALAAALAAGPEPLRSAPSSPRSKIAPRERVR